MKNQPNRHIVFDPGFGLLSLVDEYDHNERVYFGIEEKIRGMKDLNKIYKLSQPYKIQEKIPFQIPYRHLVTVIQIGKNWNGIKKILLRTGQIPEDLDIDDDNHLKQRTDHVKYWLDYFAPDNITFEVKKNMPDIHLSNDQKRVLSSFINKFNSLIWEPENIHKAIYDSSEDEKITIKTTFNTIYQVILGQEKGPRAGYFLSNLNKDFVLKRFKEAIK
jgi:lysyl-tRNA synthetase class 1